MPTDSKWPRIVLKDLDGMQKGAMALRGVFDAVLFIVALVFTVKLQGEYNDSLKTPAKANMTVPYIFEIYELKPYNGNDNISKFIATEVMDTKMCFADGDPDGCTGGISNETLLSSLRNYTQCTIGGAPRATMCSICVDPYAYRIHSNVTALDDFTLNTASASDKEIADAFLGELEGCMGRTGGKHTAHNLYKTNPWAHFLLWCGLAMVYNSNQLASLLSTDHPTVAKVIPPVTLFCVALTFYLQVGLVSLTDKDIRFDLSFATMQFVICLSAFFFVLTGHDTDERAKTTYMGIFMVSVAPSIAIILSSFHAWLEWEMLSTSVGLVTAFFGLCLCDDVLSVYWSKPKQGNSTQDSVHMHLHAMIFTSAIFLIVIYGTMNLPLAPAGDPLNGTLLFSLFIIFAVVYSLIPVLLYEVSEKDTMEILMYKELMELIFRIVVFSVIAYTFRVGV